MNVLLVLAAVCLAHTARAAPTDECVPQDTKCRTDPMDISFVVDSSATVTTEGFKQAQKFLDDLLENFEIAPDKIRASVITYGRGVYDQYAIGFNDFNNKRDLVNAINSIVYEGGDYTDTGAALKYMLEEQMSEARRKVKRVVVVLTDGDSQDYLRTKAEAEKAQNSGLNVFAIGVGPNITMQELYNIASNPRQVIPTASYANLQDILNQLRIQICEEEPEPPCRHSPTELMFVIDSSISVGEDDFELGLRFIQSFLESFEINPSTIRVAAVMFGKRVYGETAINFDEYTSAKAVSDAIMKLPWMHGTRTETGMGIDYMVDHFLPETRAHAPKVAIIITDGESQNSDKTIESARRARALGVKTVAVGIGRARTEGGKLNMDELRNIAGTLSRMLLADDYADLARIRSQLVKETCFQIAEGQREYAAQSASIYDL